MLLCVKLPLKPSSKENFVTLVFLPRLLLSGLCGSALPLEIVFISTHNCKKPFFVCQSSDDDEQCEEKDRFVAQLYKFMDDRGKC